jgi:hypothetical protein
MTDLDRHAEVTDMTLMENPGKASAERGRLPSPADVDLATTRPDTPGGIFMRQFWHAIHRSQDLAVGQAKPIRIMSEDYALYRGASGKAQVVDYRCPHRGAPIHLGWVEEDSIRCVYHGSTAPAPAWSSLPRSLASPARSASAPIRRANIWG